MRSTTPIHSRIASVRPYNDLLEPQSTVAILRRELNESRGLQCKFEELCIEVVKAERQNKRLEQTHTALQQEFLDKIKQNKNIITQLKQTIEQSSLATESKNAKIEALKEENDFLVQKVQSLEMQKTTLGHEKEEKKKELNNLNSNISTKEKVLSGLAVQKQTIKAQMQGKSGEVDDIYQEYKIRQIKITEAEKHKLSLQKQLSQLVQKRTAIQNEQRKTQTKLSELSSRLANEKQDTASLKDSAEWQQQQLDNEHSTTKYNSQDLRRALIKNKETATQLAPLKEELDEASDKMYLNSVLYGKMEAKFTQMQSYNDEMSKVLKNIKGSVLCEQEVYATFIEQMKQCIVYDEKVASALNKQTEMLENITA